MLDLTKPMRRKSVKEIVHYIGKNRAGECVVQLSKGCYATMLEDHLENIPELKVASMIVELVTFENGDCQIAVSYGVPKSMPGAKITYTEGAENPWAIEGVK